MHCGVAARPLRATRLRGDAGRARPTVHGTRLRLVPFLYAELGEPSLEREERRLIDAGGSNRPAFVGSASRFSAGRGPFPDQRVGFSLVTGKRAQPVVGPTVVYVAANRDAPARGPYAALADRALARGTVPRDRAGGLVGDAMYAAAVPRLRPGRYSIMRRRLTGTICWVAGPRSSSCRERRGLGRDRRRPVSVWPPRHGPAAVR